MTSRSAFLCVCAIVALFVYWNVPVHSGRHSVLNNLSFASLDVQVPTAVVHLQNDTLGFEKIFVLNLPERSDKRDAMSLAASLTNVTVEYVDGVKGDTIVDKAVPSGQESRNMPKSMLGSWRAHMNVIRRIVENRLSSALIVEDDVDWDIRIKSQLINFAKGSRWLQNIGNNDMTHSPYGDDWDVLWLGHCGPSIKKERMEAYVIPEDPSVPRLERLPFIGKIPDWIEAYPDHSRIIHVAHKPICTFAYALSYRGAQKVLWALSVEGLSGIFDNALADWCGSERLEEPRCISAFPPYFYQHRVAGKAGKNSDIVAEIPEIPTAETKNIQWSTRMNAEKLLAGRTDFVNAYPN